MNKISLLNSTYIFSVAVCLFVSGRLYIQIFSQGEIHRVFSFFSFICSTNDSLMLSVLNLRQPTLPFKSPANKTFPLSGIVELLLFPRCSEDCSFCSLVKRCCESYTWKTHNGFVFAFKCCSYFSFVSELFFSKRHCDLVPLW